MRLYDAGALVSAPLPGGGAVAVAGRYSYTGPLFSLISVSVGWSTGTISCAPIAGSGRLR